MSATRDEIEAFRSLLREGRVQKAYRSILAYMRALRTYFKNNPDAPDVSGLYQGQMDMTYFALFPPSLRQRNLKIAVLFNYNEFRFQVWLSGRNREVQRNYWALMRDGHWPDYRLSTPGKGVDSILEFDLLSDFDLADPDALTSTLESSIMAFIADIEDFLARYETR